MRVLKILIDKFGEDWKTKDPFKVLITTILSQRTKDANTRKASKALFGEYPKGEDVAKAGTDDIEKLIRPAGFYHVKARNIKEVSRIIVEKYGGKVPDNMKELLELPGVGRKTAGIVLVAGFDKPAIPVDVHVHRVSNRLGWADTKTPEKTEQELTEALPKKYWKDVNLTLVRFGQKVCLSRKPKCGECPVSSYCHYYKNKKVGEK